MQNLSHAISYESKVYSKGKTTLPLEIRKQLGIQDDETIIYIPRGDSFEITTSRLLLKQMQKKLHQAHDEYSVNDFILDRHKEALAEIED